MESATRRRDRGFGARGALSPLEPPPRGEGCSSARGWFDESCQRGKKRGRGRGISKRKRSAIDSVQINYVEDV